MLSTTNVRIAPATTEAERKRQRIVLMGGGAVIAALLAYLFWPVENTSSAVDVEVVAPPAQAVPVPPPPIAPPVAAAPLPDYQLFGIGGGGEKGRAAIIGLPGGGQRVVPAGRAIGPGVTMKEVGADYAILATPGGEKRLEFRKAGQTITPSQSIPPATGGFNAPALATPAARQQATTHYRLGMEPRTQGANITGYRIKGANLPLLSAAGLQAGDTLLSVNGEALDSEERFFALAETLSSTPTARITYERNGKTLTAEVKQR
ncbi:PDZ domain-containing protein [Allosphingosinicella vermicomposti]|uniref:PDZ domain-containing protein n=1 Tax=Allosphingosinicella vermicomposti TaxID=614671 RepID=UPI000D0EA356|nr:PDZ domain-containing protein [Allosphingosinicella vermicomposti]